MYLNEDQLFYILLDILNNILPIFQLQHALDFDEFQQPIPLANPDDVVKANQAVKVTGFGVEDIKVKQS